MLLGGSVSFQSQKEVFDGLQAYQASAQDQPRQLRAKTNFIRVEGNTGTFYCLVKNRSCDLLVPRSPSSISNLCPSNTLLNTAINQNSTRQAPELVVATKKKYTNTFSCEHGIDEALHVTVSIDNSLWATKNRTTSWASSKQ